MKSHFLPLLAILALTTVRAGDNQWTNIGPEGGGVSALAFDPQDVDTAYIGTGNGVYKSTDGGSTWTSSGLTGWGVSIILVHPQNTSVLYAQAAFSPDEDTDIIRIFRSTDAGATWNDVVTGARLLALDPQDTGTLYTLAGGFPQGLFKSTDAGANWTRLSGLPAGLFPFGLAIDWQNHNTLYIQLMGTVATHSVAALYKSTDGGATWNASDSGLPETFQLSGVPNALIFSPNGITVDPKNPGTLYATKFLTGVYKSTDGGTSWRAANGGMPNSPSAFPPCCSYGVIIDPRNPNTLYALGGNPANFIVYKSTNGGLSWFVVSSLGGVGFQPLLIDPQGALYVPNGAGVRKSTDGGVSWASLNFGLRTTPILSLAVDPAHSGTIYANNSMTTDGGASWFRSGADFGNAVLALAVDPQNPGTVYAGSGDSECNNYANTGVFKSVDGGANWTHLQSSPGCVAVIAVDPLNPGTVYAGANRGLFKSTDAGASWSATGVFADTLAIDPRNTGTIYAGAAAGVYKATDGGATWSTLTGLNKLSVSAWAIDPQSTDTVYAAAGGGLFKTTDGGASWQSLPGLTNIYAVVSDPRTSGAIYAGADVGVLQSADGGTNWTPLPGGPGNVRLLALDPQDPRTIYAGGPGGLSAVSLRDAAAPEE